MAGRILSREDGTVRGCGQRRVSGRIDERNASARQTVEIGSHRGIAAVDADTIGAKRIDGDEDHVGFRIEPLLSWTLGASADEACCNLYRDE